MEQYLNDIGQFELLDQASELAIVQRIRQGDVTAQAELVQSNLRLVVKIAAQYHCVGMSLEDLVQIGNIGLMDAVREFSPERSQQFVYFAAKCIKNHILNVISTQPKQTDSLDVIDDHPDRGHEIETRELQTTTMSALATLTQEEQVAMRQYAEGYSPREIGYAIYTIALRKLSHPSRTRLLL